ncbi:hypothetical protein [Streptomyces diastatochromogenes]|uniref:hypothetical protein n=1 Tax=Streptomyces diastatochromogenes TaxID=42236 RepID=UPI0036C53C94
MRNRSVRALELSLEQVRQPEDYASLLDPRLLKHARRLAARAAKGLLGIEALHTLGWFYALRVRASGDDFRAEDVETAVAAHAVCLVHGLGPLPQELLPDIVNSAWDLGTQLLEEADDDESGQRLDFAVEAWRRILHHTAADDPNESFSCHCLALALEHRFSLRGQGSDLDELIEVSRRALAVMDDDHPSLTQALTGLGGALHKRFERTQAISDLDEAIAVMRRLAAHDDASSGLPLATLCALHLERYAQTREDADLDEAIATGRQAAATLPPGHPMYDELAVGRFMALDLRFGRRGDLSHLDELSEVGLQALRAGRIGSVEQVAKLAVALHIRAEQTGSGEDLDEAISVARQAVGSAEPGDPGRGLALSALSAALGQRYERSVDLADLDEVIALRRQAVAASSDDSRRAMALSSLSLQLQDRAELSEDPADLDQAIAAAREAVAVMPPGDRLGMAATHSGLGAVLQERFKRSGDPADLDEAVVAGERAVTLIPVEFPGRPSALLDLCEGLLSRFRLTRDDADLARARALLAESDATSNALPAQRFLVCRLQGVCALLAGDPAEALTWFEQ